MKRFLAWTLHALLLAFVSCVGKVAEAQEFDGQIAAQAVDAMKGQSLVVTLRSGVQINDAKFVGPVVDPRSGHVRFIEYRQGRRSTKTKAEDIYKLSIQGRPHSLRYHGPTGSYHLIDEAVATEQMLARLKELKRNRLEPIDPESLQEANAEHLRFALDALRTLKSPLLRTEENDFAILITDFPAPHTRVFSQTIPAIFAAMNQRFGIPPQQTVFPGKVIVACFSHREHFGAFQDVVMENPNFGDAGTIVQFRGGRFVVTSHTRSFDANSLRGICWAIAGGYINRFYSDVEPPSWFTMGLRSIIVDQSLPSNRRSPLRQRQTVVTQLRRTGSLNGILQATRIADERGPIAKFLVQHLVHRDPSAVSQYILDVKAGQTPEWALQTNFGLTHETFAAELGQGLGVPNLRP